PLRSAEAVDEDVVRLPRRHRRRDAGGTVRARRVGAGVVVASQGDLGAGPASAASHVEDSVVARVTPAGLDRRRARDGWGPLEDPLWRNPRAPAAAPLRAGAARRAAEGPALRGDDGRAAAAPGEGGGRRRGRGRGRRGGRGGARRGGRRRTGGRDGADGPALVRLVP